jgi:hypothetical protein
MQAILARFAFEGGACLLDWGPGGVMCGERTVC